MAGLNKVGVSRKFLLLTSVLIIVLASSLSVCVSLNGSSGTSLENAIYVSNEAELRNAISNAAKPAVIVLDKDIRH